MPRPSCLLTLPPPPRSPLFPYTTLFRSLFTVTLADGSTKDVTPVDHDVPTIATGGDGDVSVSPDGKEIAVAMRSEEHTSELQSHSDLVCRLLLEKKNDVAAGLTKSASLQ